MILLNGQTKVEGIDISISRPRVLHQTSGDRSFIGSHSQIYFRESRTGPFLEYFYESFSKNTYK